MRTNGGEYKLDIDLVAFLLVNFVAAQQCGNSKLAERKESFYGWSLSAGVDVRDWISVTSSIDGTVLKLKFLHTAMSVILFHKTEICLEDFRERIGWRLRVN